MNLECLKHQRSDLSPWRVCMRLPKHPSLLFVGAAGALHQYGRMEESAAAEFSEASSAPESNGVAQQQQPAAAGKFSSFPSSPARQQPVVGGHFSSFPSVPTASAKFSSFPSFPPASTGGAAAGRLPVGSGFEDAVLGKLQHKAAAGPQTD